MTTRISRLGHTAVAAFAGAAAFGALAWGPTLLAPADARPIAIAPPEGAPMSFADLIDSVSPAVVSVNVVAEQEVTDLADLDRFLDQFRGMPGFEDFFERRREEEEQEGENGPRTREARSLGSGFFISEDGYIVTNNHVINGAIEIEVVLSDGRELEAEIVGADPQTDLAVIRVTEAGTYPYVAFAEEMNLRKGDWVVALGNPFGFGGTATAGIVSADGRELRGGGPYTDFLQLDAAINRGNSGGPTFDLQGRVVGVNTAIFSPTGASVGIGFAIPADLASQITQTLIRDGRVSRGWLGVTIQDLTTDMADALGLGDIEGAIVTELVDDGPAEQSGFRRNDIVLSVNGKSVEDATELTRAVGNLIAGSQNRFTILREGREMVLTVTVGERPEDPFAASSRPSSGSSSSDEAGSELSAFGASFRPLDADTRSALGLDTGERGLIITDVDRDSPLAEAGLMEGVVILEVNNRAVASVADFEAAVDQARRDGRDKVLVTARFGQITNFRTLDLPEE